LNIFFAACVAVAVDWLIIKGVMAASTAASAAEFSLESRRAAVP
jgi:hypothetical protein